MVKIKFSIFSLALIVSVLMGCSKDSVISNQKPKFIINNLIDGLKVTVKGSIIDIDGEITNTFIDWGDNYTNNLVGIDYANLEIGHVYSEPGTYTIIITASDNNEVVSTLRNPVSINFKETSLVGIKQSMYKVSGNEYLILTLNLHTYQETQQREKFNLITDVIGMLGVDFIAFQECAQNKSADIAEGIIRNDNMALIISKRLKEKYSVDYNYVWSWAHYGWTVWEEGVAILSKHPQIDTDERYISSSTSTNSITSRKVIYGSYQTPNDRINIFSAHTHWRTSLVDEEQNFQIRNIKLMVKEKGLLNLDTVSFVCGDFNGNPTSEYPWSEGYNTMMNNNEYLDSFFEIFPSANTKPAQSIYFTIGGDLPGRIDYIFMKRNAHFEVVDSQIIFMNDVIGKVSDHFGVLTKVVYIQ